MARSSVTSEQHAYIKILKSTVSGATTACVGLYNVGCGRSGTIALPPPSQLEQNKRNLQLISHSPSSYTLYLHPLLLMTLSVWATNWNDFCLHASTMLEKENIDTVVFLGLNDWKSSEVSQPLRKRVQPLTMANLPALSRHPACTFSPHTGTKFMAFEL